MKRGPAALNRILVLVVGLALAAVGAAALAWDRDVTAVRDAVGRVDRERVTALPDQSWWTWALGATLAVCVVLGVTVLAVDLIRRRVAAGTMLETGTGTPVAIDLGAVATGVAVELERFPGVRRTRGRALSDRGLATVQITVDADPYADVPALIAAAERIAATTTTALGGADVTDVAVRVLLHLDPAGQVPPPARED
ncbi:hypothetical protein [Prescottella sp. R16]|uniref:hypothetical protein n=1 Tax=Prescottella sp. R16 TaxID=3064529 RepID=UPI00272E4590|nr:hypothetical protein [Prescottella sp. R16]